LTISIFRMFPLFLIIPTSDFPKMSTGPFVNQVMIIIFYYFVLYFYLFFR
jgi:hypothetical protein